MFRIKLIGVLLLCLSGCQSAAQSPAMEECSLSSLYAQRDLQAMIICADSIMLNRTLSFEEQELKGKAELGLSLFNRAIVTYSILIDKLTLDASTDKEKLADFLLSRSWSYVMLQQYDSAATDIRFAKTLTNDSASYSLIYMQKAMINFYAENMEFTLPYLDSAIAYYSDNQIAFKLRGSYYRGQGNFQLALSDINNSIRLNPNDGEAYSIKGLIFLNQADYNNAVSCFKQAISLDPLDASYHLNLAKAFSNQFEFLLACEEYKKSVELGGDVDAEFRDFCNGFYR